MARAKIKETFDYVLVLTTYGAVFVTGYAGKSAKWDKKSKPLAMSKGVAEDMSLGLNLNGYTAVHVVSPIEINFQPYLYDKGEFVWKWDKGEENEED